MELPAYQWPTVCNVLRSMCGKMDGHSLRRQGTIILLSTIFFRTLGLNELW